MVMGMPDRWYYKEVEIDDKKLSKIMKKKFRFDDCFKCEEDIKI